MKHLESYYHKIAYEIVESIEEDWIKAWIIIEIIEDYGEYVGQYMISDTADEPESFWIERPLRKLLREFWNEFKKAGRAWDSATFTLFPNGDFNIDYTYVSKNKDE